MVFSSHGNGLHTGLLSQRIVDVATAMGGGSCSLGGGGAGPCGGDLCPVDLGEPSPVVRSAVPGGEVALAFCRSSLGDQNIAAESDSCPGCGSFCIWLPAGHYSLPAPGDAGICQPFPVGILFAGAAVG